MDRWHDGWVHDYRKLEAWRLARDLVVAVYEATEVFPDAERFGLASQMRRAAVSITANVAEGAGRGSDPDFARFVRYAVGSSTELESHVEVSEALGLISADDADRLREELGRVRAMLVQLARSLERKTAT